MKINWGIVLWSVVGIIMLGLVFWLAVNTAEGMSICHEMNVTRCNK